MGLKQQLWGWGAHVLPWMGGAALMGGIAVACGGSQDRPRLPPPVYEKPELPPWQGTETTVPDDFEDIAEGPWLDDEPPVAAGGAGGAPPAPPSTPRDVAPEKPSRTTPPDVPESSSAEPATPGTSTTGTP